jgi:hypothetical protein
MKTEYLTTRDKKREGYREKPLPELMQLYEPGLFENEFKQKR